ncbi:FAD binding domain-containing protein [Desulfovibrio sp. OttesenSCG-928-M14]|nr:FAD binding domain-containing protein [Desulfovibrio sp. OttesenSCG-928-M14]
MKLTFTVNGESRTVECHPLTRLLDLLRNDLTLTGCKEGCGEGECGVCSIIMDGRLVNACMIPAIQASGATLLTIEGLEQNGVPDVLQQAFIDEGAVQCGFCTPGMVLAARVLLQDSANPTFEDTRTALSGNLCRCTGYGRIYAAVNKAVEAGYRPVWQGCPNDVTVPEFSEAERECFFRPKNLDEALNILSRHPDITLLSGNTDIGPDMKSGKLQPRKAMDIFHLADLKRIELRDGHIHIGSAVTNTQIMESRLVGAQLPALRAASSKCAAPAIRNRATIGGNICTASGAADLPVALLALEASVKLRNAKGRERILPLQAFIKGYRQIDRQPDELLISIIIPMPGDKVVQEFFKRGSRAALTLARVSLALAVELDEGVIVKARAAAGSMSPIPGRLPELEAALQGQKLDAALVAKAVATVKAEVKPRKSATYRKAITGNLVRRFLEKYSV